MKSLKIDFNERLKSGLNNNNIFSNFNNNYYSIIDIFYYYFYLISKIKNSSNLIILICNSSIESHILSFLLILSKYDVYLVNKYSNEIIKNIDEHTIITFENNFKFANSKAKDIIFAISIDEFLKWTHPSFDILKLIKNYIKNNNIGKSIFMSSGSTGKPKLIPLNYEQINNCYLNVKEGFLESILSLNIISVHDTSFVIILPFLFSFCCNKKAKIFASKLIASKNPILNLGSFFQNNNNFTIISVPSVYRIILKLFKDEFANNIKYSNLITCGEPLDKKLALDIFNYNPNSFFNLYGSTEVAPWIIYLDVNNYLDAIDNMSNIPAVLPAGKTLPNVDFLITDKEELLIQSKSQFNGYLNHDNLNTFENIKSKKYFRTGDLFNKKDDLLYCKGRINSSIKIAGSFINPILLEIELKEELNIENLIIIPSIIECKLFIVVFFDALNFFNANITKKIKEIINKKTSIKIPIKFIQDKRNIIYLRSGKIDRKFYANYYLNNVDT